MRKTQNVIGHEAKFKRMNEFRLTQEELASKLKVSRDVISRLENGYRVRAEKAILKFLGISTEMEALGE